MSLSNLSLTDIKKRLNRMRIELHPQGSNFLYYPNEADLEQASELCFTMYQAIKAEPNERWQYLRLQMFIPDHYHEDTRSRALEKHETSTEVLQEISIQTFVRKFLENIKSKLPTYESWGSIFYTIEEVQHFAPDIFADADIDEYTYDRWENGYDNWRLLKAPAAENGALILAPYSKEYSPESGKGYVIEYATAYELNRIWTKQQELGEAYIEATVKRYKENFKNNLARSHEPKLFHDQILIRYESILWDRDFVDEMKTFNYLTKGGRRWDLLPPASSFAKGVRFKNEIAYLVKQYVVNGQDVFQFVTPKFLDTFDVDFIQGDAVSMYRFYRWLKDDYQLYGEVQTSGRDTEVITFESLFTTPGHAEATLSVLREIGVTGDGNRWVYGTRKNAIMALLTILKKRSWFNFTQTEKELAQIIAKKLGTEIKQQTISQYNTDGPPKYAIDILVRLGDLLPPD